MTTTLKDYGLILKRRKWTIGIAMLIALGVAIAINVTTQPVYRAMSRIEIEREPSRSILTGEMTQSMTFQTETMGLTTAAEMVTNRRLMGQVAETLKGQPGVMDDVTRGLGTDRQVDWLLEHVIVEPVHNTRLIGIRAEHWDPRKAELISNLVAQTFVDDQTRQREQGAGNLVGYLQQQVQQVKGKIEFAERSLMNGDAVDPFTLEKRLEQLTLTSGDLQRKLTISNSELARGRRIYKGLHPKLVGLESENVAMREEIAAAELEMRRINDALQRYSIVQNEIKSNRDLHSLLMLKLQEAKINGQAQTNLVRVVQSAAARPDPVRPKKGLNIAVCLVAGLLAGFGLAFLRENLRPTIRTPDQINQYLQLPVLGLIPKVARP